MMVTTGQGFVPADLDRRSFLKGGAGAVAALLLGRRLALGSPAQGGAPLTARELEVLRALCEGVVTPAPGAPTAAEADVAGRIVKELRYHPDRFSEDVRASLLLVEYGGLLHLSPAPLTRRSPEAQEQRLQQMATSWLVLERQAWSGLRGLVLFLYYTDERTWGSVGYPGPLWPLRKLPEASNAAGEGP